MGFFSRKPRPPNRPPSRAAARALLPEHVEIGLNGRDVTVRLRRHPAARRYTLRVGRVGAEPVVTVPAGGSLGGALSFLDRYRGWLGQRLEAQPEALPFAPGTTIPLRGVDHMIVGSAGRGTVHIDTDAEGRPAIVVPGAPEHLARRLTDWLKRQARHDLEAAVFRHAATAGVRPVAIRLRDPKARWGSCSSRGNLSFSWRLVLAPPLVLDYLAAHEVAHLRQMNHGPAFWRLVHELCPETERAEAWLRTQGSALFAVGAAGSPE